MKINFENRFNIGSTNIDIQTDIFLTTSLRTKQSFHFYLHTKTPGNTRFITFILQQPSPTIMSDLRMSSYDSCTSSSGDHTDSDDFPLFNSVRKTAAERKNEKKKKPRSQKVRQGPRLRDVAGESSSGSTERSFSHVLEMKMIQDQRDWIRRTENRFFYYGDLPDIESASEITYDSDDTIPSSPTMRYRRQPKLVTRRSLFFGPYGQSIIDRGLDWYRSKARKRE